jgi:hypothetical protein
MDLILTFLIWMWYAFKLLPDLIFTASSIYIPHFIGFRAVQVLVGILIMIPEKLEHFWL